MKEKILTITVPSYNTERFIPTVLPTFLSDSILEDIEILLINDGSKDRTSEVAHEYEKQYPGTIKVIDKANGGHGSTINCGIKEASGKYFKVVDGDDWVNTCELEKFVQSLKRMDVDLILTPHNRVAEGTQQIERKEVVYMQENRLYSFSEALPSLNHMYAMHSVTFKTELLRTIPAIDEHCFYVDQEFILYPIERVNNISYLPYCVYQYRVGANEQSMSMMNMQKNRKMHERVIRSLIDFVSAKESLEQEKKEFIESKIASMCEKQLTIYLSMEPSKAVKAELNDFIAGIKKETEIYKKVPGKKARILLTAPGMYYPLSVVYRKWK